MKLALFDLDNTLLEGDSDYEWAQFLIEEGVLHADEYNAKNDWFYERWRTEFKTWNRSPRGDSTRPCSAIWH